jgi:hypothetical protein
MSAYEAKRLVEQKKKEDEDKLRPLVKLAFHSFYSPHRAGYGGRNEHITSTMFKTHQKALIDAGVTVEHLKNPNINRARVKGDPFGANNIMCGSNTWDKRVIDMTFLLSAKKPFIELVHKDGVWAGSGFYAVQWID